MTGLARFTFTFLTLSLVGSTLGAQSRPSSRQRHQYVAAEPSLDSTSIQLAVTDFRTGEPVPALICVGHRERLELVTDPRGGVRITNLPQTNVPVRVLAAGYDADSLIFFPGKRGRSQAAVRLVPNTSASAAPRCG